MLPTERRVTLAELRHNTGERGTRKWIAFEGRVYDITDCPRWRGDLHERLHYPGQDLTTEMPEAPHKQDVFTRPCVKLVGVLFT